MSTFLPLAVAAIAVLYVAALFVGAAFSAIKPLVVRLMGAPRTRRNMRKAQALNRALKDIDARESEAIRNRIIGRAHVADGLAQPKAKVTPAEVFERSNASQEVAA